MYGSSIRSNRKVQLSLKVRDVSGKPVLNDKTNEPRTKTIEFDPYKVDMSKLLLVTSRARESKMTAELWEMLSDDYYSCEDLHKNCHQTQP